MVAYKVVRKGRYYAGDWEHGYTRTGYLPDMQGSNVHRPIGHNQGWALEDDAQPIPDDTGLGWYLPGVHAFQNYIDATRVQNMYACDAIVKVYLRGPIAAGKQYSAAVVVYREMTILGEV
jgi:hypothetical protein